MYKIIIVFILLITSNKFYSEDKEILLLKYYLPEKLENWYNENSENPNAKGSWKICNVYSQPDKKANIIGEIWARYDKNIGNFIICIKPNNTNSYVIWNNQIGDWGYGINDFVSESYNDYAKLSDKIFLSSAWIKLKKEDGINGRVYPIVGELFNFPKIKVINLKSGKEMTLNKGVYYVLSKEGNNYIIRKEIPSDMPCDVEKVEKIDGNKIVKYKIQIESLFDKQSKVNISLAYPRGC